MRGRACGQVVVRVGARAAAPARALFPTHPPHPPANTHPPARCQTGPEQTRSAGSCARRSCCRECPPITRGGGWVGGGRAGGGGRGHAGEARRPRPRPRPLLPASNARVSTHTTLCTLCTPHLHGAVLEDVGGRDVAPLLDRVTLGINVHLGGGWGRWDGVGLGGWVAALLGARGAGCSLLLPHALPPPAPAPRHAPRTTFTRAVLPSVM